MKPERPTLDGRTRYRCMLVALDDAAARACKLAVSPLDAVVVKDVREACAKMSEILPLIVVYADAAPPAEMAEVVDLAGACGAEVLAVAVPVDGKLLGGRILAALQKAERRRVPR